MAAHLATGIGQILASLKDNTINQDIIRSAVELSTFTEDNYDVWTVLQNYVHSENTDTDRLRLEQELVKLQPEIIKEWQTLGEPRTREEWWQARLARKNK